MGRTVFADLILVIAPFVVAVTLVWIAKHKP